MDRERRFIYFRIPKAANSTVSYAISNIETENGDSAGAYKSGYDRASSLGFLETYRLHQRFFLFSVVRNPYTRVASAYLDKIQGQKRQRTPVARALGRASTAPITFQEFCAYLAKGGYRDDVHWFRQTDLIPCGIDRLDYLGSVETLTKDLNAIRTQLSLTSETGRSDWKHGKTGASSRLFELYDDESRICVFETYKQDFELLGYAKSLDKNDQPPLRASMA
ncbi:sulfotransferase family protein [Thioalkalivibrio sp. AKL10]|uniref:sulfotransferase family protein n=1 Tax=Thioalkalivibrio sp. AKL10 TaxID=1158158 RepID=UPI00035E1006|nr:sulfotransferase family protein [Thioalkalivibrio sp. AKL10]